MMINKEEHFARPWKVNEIAHDFLLWDVWEVPISANNSKTENFLSFYQIVWETFKKVSNSSTLAGFLFTLRYWLSKIFPLDRNVNTLPIPGCRETTLKSRLNTDDLKKSSIAQSVQDDKSDLEFRPVYLFENESLHELSNNTVHALLHLGWIKKKDSCYTATLAIYVKARGMYGKLYLKLIEPFRHHIVYPALMKAIKAGWHEYITCKSGAADVNSGFTRT